MSFSTRRNCFVKLLKSNAWVRKNDSERHHLCRISPTISIVDLCVPKKIISKHEYYFRLVIKCNWRVYLFKVPHFETSPAAVRLFQLYKQDCETVGIVVRMLISKDPTLGPTLLSALHKNLVEIGDKYLENLSRFISEVSALVKPNQT